MNFLDQFRYTFDNLSELSIPETQSTETRASYNNPHLKSLLSTSVKVTPEIFPKVAKAIGDVFERLKLKNNFSFFVTANHLQTQAMCAMMPQSSNAEIIITSKMIDLLNNEELQNVIAHEVSHFYYQHSLYPRPDQAKTKTEFWNDKFKSNIERDAVVNSEYESLDWQLIRIWECEISDKKLEDLILIIRKS